MADTMRPGSGLAWRPTRGAIGARTAALLVACRPMTAMVASVLASVLLLGGCYGGPGVNHYVGILDTLHIPADWEFVATERRGPGEEFQCEPVFTSTCPGAARWYALSGEYTSALEAARAIKEALPDVTPIQLWPLSS